MLGNGSFFPTGSSVAKSGLVDDPTKVKSAMVQSDDFIYGGGGGGGGGSSRNRQSRMMDYDFSQSEYSGSVSTQHLLKVASLDIDPSISSFNGASTIIDLTQTPSDDILSTCPAQKYIIDVHDQGSEMSVVSDKSVRSSYRTGSRYSSNQSYSTAISSYLPNTYSEYTRNHCPHPKASSHRNDHHPITEKNQTHERRNAGRIPSHTNTLHDSNTFRRAAGEIHRESEIQTTSMTLGSLLQCVNPTVPGEADIPSQWVAQAAAMKALRSDEDALDRIFNTVERFACQDDKDLGREMRDELDQQDFLVVSCQPSLQQFMNESSCPQLYGKKSELKPRGDILDNVFEGMESIVCQDNGDWGPRHFVSNRKDALDTVFEKFEHVACHNGFTVASIQNRGLSTLKKLSKDYGPSAFKANTSRQGLDRNSTDMLERFGKNFEGALCTKAPSFEGSLYARPIAECGQEGDVLDTVFERLEQAACRDPPPTDGGYFDTSVYDLDMQNSLVCSPSESKDWYEACSRGEVMRKPSWRNTQPARRNKQPDKARHKAKASRHVQDIYTEASLPRQNESHLSGRERAKNSLERIRAVRERYLSETRYSADGPYM